MNRLITTLFCLLLISLPASAQQRELKPGINYTTLAKPKVAEPTKAVPAEETAIENTPKEVQDPATLVWNKYKELATGQTQEQKAAEKGTQKDIEKPETPKKPSIDKPVAKSPGHASGVEKQQSGFAAILDEWKNSKDTKKEIRSKSFKVPTSAKTAKDPS